MAKGTRDLNVSIALVGRKGTGKSTELAKLARAYPPDKKVLILDVNGSPAYNGFQQIELRQVRLLTKGVVKLMGTPTPETLQVISENFKGGLVVFEDCTKYIEGNVHPVIKTFLVDHRMNQCDLIFTFHALKRVPPFFWEMLTYVQLFKTQEEFESGTNKKRIPNYETILRAFNRVRAHPDPHYSITVETLT